MPTTQLAYHCNVSYRRIRHQNSSQRCRRCCGINPHECRSVPANRALTGSPPESIHLFPRTSEAHWARNTSDGLWHSRSCANGKHLWDELATEGMGVGKTFRRAFHNMLVFRSIVRDDGTLILDCNVPQ